MRILEVRDGFIKFETSKKISLSSFLQVNDSTKSYIAQVIQTKKTENGSIAFAKILFLYDGTLKNYDKSIPDKNAEIAEFTFDIMSKSIEYKTPIIAGKFIDGSIDIPIDKSCFDKKMLISVDLPKTNNRIISNLTKQFSYLGKTLVIDMLGIIDGQKYVAGTDFKLPLNKDSLRFMYEDCLNDATSDSKSLIKEIFHDLAEYSETVPFLPFGALKSIVDDMVDKQHIFKLLVLKNKLEKFARQGYFALTAKEAQNLHKILEEKNVVVDLSKLDTTFQNRYLDTIYSFLDGSTQVFLEASNAVSKKNIKNILENETIPAVFVTHSKFKFINEIKSMFDNFIIEPSFTNNETFKIYSAFLNSMPKETYLLVGEGTNYIPFVSSLEAVVNIPQPKNEETVTVCEEDLEDTENEISEQTAEEPAQEKSEELTNMPAEDKTCLEEEVVQEEPPVSESVSAAEEEEEETEDFHTITHAIAEEVIEQKANELINKISEEVTETEQKSESLFETEEDSLEEDSQEEYVPEVQEPKEELPIEELPEVNEEITPPEESVLEPEVIDETEELEVLQETETETETEIKKEEEEPIEPLQEEFHTEIDEIQTIEMPEDIAELTDEIELEAVEETTEEPEITENIPEEVLPEVKSSFEDRMNIDTDTIGFKEYSEDDLQEELEIDSDIISLNEDDQFDEIVELDASEEIGEDTILVDFEDEEEDESLTEEDLDKQIVEDVDKVFTTIKEDSISDSDLDFIDELNNEEDAELEELQTDGTVEELPENFEENSEDGFLEPIEEQTEILQEEENEGEILETKNTKTPIVPVYDADIPQEDLVMSDPIAQGDMVVHAKYGTGTVEKMIKYGTKTLFSINFDNVGRRLLDPTLTEIKKA